MGVIKPPWISDEWFRQCPFNYCDHFGDKRLLATVCKVCKEEKDREEKLIKEGKDPNDPNLAMQDVGEKLGQTLVLIKKHAEEMGIDLENLEPEPEDVYDLSTDPLYEIVKDYGECTEDVLKSLQALQKMDIKIDPVLLQKAFDALVHSRYYVMAKIYRALSSKYEDKEDDEIFDAKTSAFFAYIAILRNCEILIVLVKTQKPLLLGFEKNYYKYSKLSLKMASIIKKEFFPEDQLIYEEFGV